MFETRRTVYSTKIFSEKYIYSGIRSGFFCFNSASARRIQRYWDTRPSIASQTRVEHVRSTKATRHPNVGGRSAPLLSRTRGFFLAICSVTPFFSFSSCVFSCVHARGGAGRKGILDTNSSAFGISKSHELRCVHVIAESVPQPPRRALRSCAASWVVGFRRCVPI